MVLQDENMNNKIFIDDDIFTKHIKFILTEFEYGYKITCNSDYFQVDFENVNNLIINATSFEYNNQTNFITINGQHDVMCIKTIKDEEILHITSTNDTLVIESCDIPVFIENENDGIYPKFEISLSDCFYKVKIFINESEYIDIPYYRSHDDIVKTLEYLNSLVEYFTDIEPNFIYELCNNDTMNLIISINDMYDTAILKYCINEQGIILIESDNTNFVEWHKFFKLIIDKKWEVTFMNSDTLID